MHLSSRDMRSKFRPVVPAGRSAQNLNDFFQVCSTFSLHFNGHFPGGSGLAGTRMSPFWILSKLWMMEVVMTIGAIRRTKVVKSSPQTNQHPVLYKQHALPVAQSTVSTVSEHWRKSLHYTGLENLIRNRPQVLDLHFMLYRPRLYESIYTVMMEATGTRQRSCLRRLGGIVTLQPNSLNACITSHLTLYVITGPRNLSA